MQYRGHYARPACYSDSIWNERIQINRLSSSDLLLGRCLFSAQKTALKQHNSSLHVGLHTLVAHTVLVTRRTLYSVKSTITDIFITEMLSIYFEEET